MTIENIILIATIALTAVFALWFAFRGLRRGWVKALFTTGNIVLSATLACFLSRDFTTIARDYLYPLVGKILGLFDISLEEMLAGYEQFTPFLPLILGIVLTPMFFLLFFFIFRTIFGFVLSFFFRPKRRVINEEGEKVKVKRHVPGWSRAVGALIGVCNGVLLLAVMLIPAVGFLNMGLHVTDALYEKGAPARDSGSADAQIYYVVEDYVKPASKNWLVSSVYNTLGEPMFNYMITTTYDDAEVFLENELIAVVHLLNQGKDFSNTDFSQMDGDAVDNMHGMVDVIEESVLMPELAATLISELGHAWSSGDSILGMERPDMGELLNPTFDVLLKILSTTDRELLVADLNTMIDFLDLLVDSGILANMGDSSKIMDTLSTNKTLISDMTSLFEQNEHLAPMAKEIKSLMVRAVTQTLNMEDSELTGKLTESINVYKDDPDQLSNELGNIVTDYMADQNIQAEVSKEITDEVADAICKEFAGQTEVSEEEVIDFVLNYASGNLVDEDGEIDLDGDGIPDGDIDDLPDDLPDNIPGM